MAIFREVGKIKKNTEGPDDNSSGRFIHRGNQAGELILRFMSPFTTFAGDFTNRFDLLQRRRPRHLANHFAQHIAQLANIPTQKFVTHSCQFASA